MNTFCMSLWPATTSTVSTVAYQQVSANLNALDDSRHINHIFCHIIDYGPDDVHR